MMLILFLGHILALSKPFNAFISLLLSLCKNGNISAWVVCFFSLSLAWVNWGLGLIFGAILARKVAEHAQKNKFPINYPLIGACGYSGLMFWHGGLSGSAPVTINTPDHFLFDQIGIIPVEATLFSTMNNFTSLAVLIILPLFAYFISSRSTYKDSD